MEEKKRKAKRKLQGKKVEAGARCLDESAYQSGSLPSPPVNPMGLQLRQGSQTKGLSIEPGPPGKFVAPENQSMVNFRQCAKLTLAEESMPPAW